MPLINRPSTTWTDLLFGPRKEEQQSITEAIAAKQLGLLGSPPVDTRRVYPQQYTYQSPSDRQMFELLFPQGPEAAMGLAQPMFTAYHGTPHTFKRFDMSKIGTGEGAQAYGHGLYFAENPETAAVYGRTTSRQFNTLTYGGKKVSDIGGDKGLLLEQLYSDTSGDLTKLPDAIKRLKEYLGIENPELLKELKNINPSKFGKYEHPGTVMKVDIKPPVERFLDWDKPLSQQTPEVRKVIDPLVKEFASDMNKTGHPLDINIANGQDLHTWMARKRGQEMFTKSGGAIRNEPDDKWVAEFLNSRGIPGIRYLDQGSRQSGKGTYNYVVFNDKDVEILGRE